MTRLAEQSSRAPQPSLRGAALGALAEGLALLVLLALCVAFLFVAQQNPAIYTLDGERDALSARGLYGVERNELFSYRWSAGGAEVRLPLRHTSGRAYIATLTALAQQPEGPQTIGFLLNDRLLAETTPERALRTYRLLLDPAEGDAAMRFGFVTQPFRPAGEGRELGLMVVNIALRPLATLDWLALAGLPSGLLALWALIRWRAGRSVTLAIVALQTLALMAAFSLYRPDALPFFWLAAPALAAAAAAVFVAREGPARIGLAALTALAGYSSVIWRAGFTDDAFISFQYARNLVAGHGLVFNPGERVEGYTNFLWTILAALAIRMGGDPVFWSYLAGMAIGLALALLAYHLAARLLGAAWGLAAALLVACSQSVLVYTTRGAGMETGLFALLALLGSTLYLAALRLDAVSAGARGDMLARAGVVFALTALTRPEGMMLIALTSAHLLVVALWGRAVAVSPATERTALLPPGLFAPRNLLGAIRETLPLPLAFGAIFGPYFAWRFWYYGELLPNTFYAKTGGGVEQWLRGLEYAADFALVFGGPLLLLAIAAPFLATSGAWRRPIDRLLTALAHPLGYLALVCGVYTAYIIIVGGDHFPGERFFVPLVPWLAILIAAGCASLAAHPISRRAPRLAHLILALAVSVAAFGAINRGAPLDRRVVGNDESVWIWADLGLWLNENTAPDESVAAGGIGAIAYYSQRVTVDLYGLADKHIARVEVEGMGAGAAGHEKRDPEYVLNVRRPTYIPRLWEEYFGGAAALQDQYELIDIRTRRGFDMQLWRRLPETP